MQKLKLNRLSDHQLAEKQMNCVLGGGIGPDGKCDRTCCCGCLGSSSSDDNARANMHGGLVTVGGVCGPLTS